MYDSEGRRNDADVPVTGCGPILSVSATPLRPLRQQIFETVRAAGRTARADVTRSLGISPGSATTLSAELIAAGFLREVEGLPLSLIQL